MIAWAVSRPAAVAACAVAILLAGGIAFARLPLATRTTVELPRLQVRAEWPGASAELVETYLTAPVEAAIQSVRGVQSVSSESGDGSSALTVELERDAEVQLARLGILERLELLRSDLPAGATSPTVGNFVPEELDEQPLLEYTVSGPYTAGTLSRLAREVLLPRVSAVEGVSGVQSFGGAEAGVSVSYDARRARQLGVAPETIAEALRRSRLVQALGEERAGASERRVVLRDEPGAIDALAELPVAGSGGQLHRLGELATIRPEEDAAGRFYRIDGQPAVSLAIGRLPGADAIKTAARVRAAMAELERTLPAGVRLEVASDESIELAEQLAELLLRGAIAFGAVMLVLGLALRNARAVGLVMASAAVAIAGTALGLYLLGVPANLLTLAGLGMGIGILVQNGLVVVERLRAAPDTGTGRAEAGRRIAPAVIGSTLTTAVVLFPFLFLQGNARAAFVPFAAAFTLALGWSVVASLVMVPALAAGHARGAGGFPRSRRIYGRVVGGLARWRWATLLVTAGALGLVGWGFVTKVPRSAFMPWFGERTTLNASLSFPRGSDPESLDRGMREFEALTVGLPGVDQVVTRGMPDGAFMRVVFEKEAGLGPLPYELEEALTQRAILIGGAQVSVRGQGPGFYSGGGGAGMSYRMKVLGYSYDGVEQLARDLQQRLERIPRVRDVDIDAGSFWRRERAFTVVLQPDRAALARYGLTARDFAGVVAREVRGPVGTQRLEIGGEELEVSLKASGARERTLDELRATLVANPLGAPVRLGDLARIDEREAVSNVSREDQQYVRVVSYDFRGPAKLANRTHDAFMASIAVPAGYTVGDDYFAWEDDESTQGLWLVFGIGIVLVLLAVAMVFDSVWAAAIVFLSLPVALAGVAAAFWVAGAAFSREAAVGVILVVGLSVNQVILLVDAALERRAARRQAGRSGLSVADVVAAAEERSGMIVLVTLTTLASLLPLALGTDADSLFGAIALATVGGTIAGTVGAMLVVPAMVVGRGVGRTDALMAEIPPHG